MGEGFHRPPALADAFQERPARPRARPHDRPSFNGGEQAGGSGRARGIRIRDAVCCCSQGVTAGPHEVAGAATGDDFRGLSDVGGPCGADRTRERRAAWRQGSWGAGESLSSSATAARSRMDCRVRPGREPRERDWRRWRRGWISDGTARAPLPFHTPPPSAATKCTPSRPPSTTASDLAPRCDVVRCVCSLGQSNRHRSIGITPSRSRCRHWRSWHCWPDGEECSSPAQSLPLPGVRASAGFPGAWFGRRICVPVFHRPLDPRELSRWCEPKNQQ